jgi:hypothetical protein
VISSIADPGLIKNSYIHGANSFIEKSTPYETFVEKIDILNKYWFESAMIPEAN